VGPVIRHVWPIFHPETCHGIATVRANHLPAGSQPELLQIYHVALKAWGLNWVWFLKAMGKPSGSGGFKYPFKVPFIHSLSQTYPRKMGVQQEILAKLPWFYRHGQRMITVKFLDWTTQGPPWKTGYRIFGDFQSNMGDLSQTKKLIWSKQTSYTTDIKTRSATEVGQANEFTIPYAPWCWYIYLQNWAICWVNVGQYSIHGAYIWLFGYQGFLEIQKNDVSTLLESSDFSPERSDTNQSSRRKVRKDLLKLPNSDMPSNAMMFTKSFSIPWSKRAQNAYCWTVLKQKAQGNRMKQDIPSETNAAPKVPVGLPGCLPKLPPWSHPAVGIQDTLAEKKQ